MKLLGYLTFGAICIGVFIVATIYFPHDATLSEKAVGPDLYLKNAKVYVREHAYNRSLHHLDLAIQSIQAIEQELDENSKKTVDVAINRLKLVYDEILNDSLQENDMNDAFMRALNALSFAEIRVSEHFIESDDLESARIALKYGKVHIKNALNYSNGNARDYELHIYEEIDAVMDDDSLTKQEIITKLEHMLAELDTLVEGDQAKL